MAFDEGVAQRLRETLDFMESYVEKKMFGGLCFLIHGNMACGLINDEVIVRVGPENYEQYLQEEHTRVFDFTGRVMKGWVVVIPEGHESDQDLSRWVRAGVDYALTLPPK
ncbi:MAG: TfoX family protein [Desulfobacteraceae bacterium]|nr:MAG: TfoX family protein [Desulfobacteraceae bacterium]